MDNNTTRCSFSFPPMFFCLINIKRDRVTVYSCFTIVPQHQTLNYNQINILMNNNKSKNNIRYIKK